MYECVCFGVHASVQLACHTFLILHASGFSMDAWELLIDISLGISYGCLGTSNILVFVLMKHDPVQIQRHVNMAYHKLLNAPWGA